MAAALLLACGCGPGPSPDGERAGSAARTGSRSQALTAGPDFVVTRVSAPPSARPWYGFDVELSVCNHGLYADHASTVHVVLSDDAHIDGADAVLASAPVGYLHPGRCQTMLVPVPTGAHTGLFVVGAIVDPDDHTMETDETNNTKAGGTIAIGDEPDLVVTALHGPPSVRPWHGFEVEVSVCNHGQTWIPGTSVDIVLSEDEVIDLATDQPIGHLGLGSLDMGQCVTVAVPVHASVPDGVYLLGAIVDAAGNIPEISESNNTRAGPILGVGHDPDLVVTRIDAPPSAPPWGIIQVTATVCNRGQQWLSWTTVDIVLSDDDIIDMDTDVLAGSAPVHYLDAGRCTVVPVPIQIAVPDGSYVLGAIVDAARSTPEIIETNNAFAGPRLAVGHGPDLVVTRISAPPSVRPWHGFEARVTLCNHGNESAPDARVELMLSPDGEIDEHDMPAGGAWVGYLHPGQCSAATVWAYAGVSDGTYVLGAIADATQSTPEIIETNNAFAGPILGVGHGPDLAVIEVSGPPTVLPWNSFEAAVTICNRGNEDSGHGYLQVLLSRDDTVDLLDMPAGFASFDMLRAGQCRAVLVPAHAGGLEGVHFLGARVQGSYGNADLNHHNDALLDGLLGVGQGPDLVVTRIGAPPTILPGSTFEAMVTVCNQGQGPSWGTFVELMLAAGGTIDVHDMPVGGAPLGHLAPDSCTTVRVPVHAHALEGEYTLIAIVDPYGHEHEIIESNNLHAGPLLGVGHGPDLVVTRIHAPPSLLPGTHAQAAVTVCNQGQGPSYGNDVVLSLSPDGEIHGPDPYADHAYLPWLEPGACATVRAPFHTGMHQGAHTLIAIVDPYGYEPELIESNNAYAGPLLGVGHGPDLMVSALAGPPSLLPGDSFAATATVCNQGQGPSYGGELSLVLSPSSKIHGADPYAQRTYLPWLEPGACTTLPLWSHAHVYHEGAYTLGAVVEPYDFEHELIASNNVYAGPVVGVGHGPDLVVSALAGPPSLLPGDSFAATATVCNQGQSPSHDSEVVLVLSQDGEIHGPDPYADHASLPWLEPGACATVSVPGHAHVYHEGAYTLGAIVDPWNHQHELVERNNAYTGPLVGVGHGPDLVVTAVSGPPSIRSGDSFEVTTTVCNHGQSPSNGNELHLMLSPDGEVGFWDPIEGHAALPSMAPGVCMTVSILTYAYLPDGAYVPVVIADPYDHERELVERNNTAAGAPIAVTPH